MAYGPQGTVHYPAKSPKTKEAAKKEEKRISESVVHTQKFIHCQVYLPDKKHTHSRHISPSFMTQIPSRATRTTYPGNFDRKFNYPLCVYTHCEQSKQKIRLLISRIHTGPRRYNLIAAPKRNHLTAVWPMSLHYPPICHLP
jgi:hypothetical protein